MTYFSKTFRWALALALGATAAMTGPSYADRAATANERAAEGKLLQMPVTDFRFNATLVTTSKVDEIIRPGDVIARFEVHVTNTARLKINTIPRRGSYPQSVPAGTILFEVQLDNGVGYCTPVLPDQGLRRAQCFRDINKDGTFDAGYITESIDRGLRIYSARLQGLSPIPQTPYEVTPGDLIPSEPADVVLKIISGNKIKFDYKLNGIRLTGEECELNSEKPCKLMNQAYFFELKDGGLRILAEQDLNAS
ncbi:MAG: hypothetical protein ACK5XZ_10610 [Hyphomonadaceae bacterium]|jgi:hypothetical protein|uniref:hypothetical protein n=1 Tax=Aquidulcibacter sp. TaxID=2052990 RepID=UPI0026130F14|nr:hypothetical protein [Aquidulcibacter sp.]MCE2889562.1 hypothetical protein [Hyphomonadaceae bacterium]